MKTVFGDLSAKFEKIIELDGKLSENHALKKGVRKWAVFKQLMTIVNTTVIVLPLVADLCSPSMQERHWQARIPKPRHEPCP